MVRVSKNKRVNKAIKSIFGKFKEFIEGHLTYAILDSTDNSVVLNKGLFKQLQKECGADTAKIMVFKSEGRYAFTLNPNVEQDTQFAEIQYNSKYKCVGFETLIPSVNRIFYDYGLPAQCCAKMMVKKCKCNSLVYWEFIKPKI